MSHVQPEFDLGGNVGGNPPPSSESKTTDLFLGLQPSEMANQQAINTANVLMRRLGVTAAVRPQHVTLWPLGKRGRFSNLDLAAKMEQLSSIFFEPFELEFDEIMSFARRDDNPALVLCCGQRNESLFELYRKVIEAQTQPGLEVKSVPTWTPHMTLFYSNRKIIRQQLKPSIRWLVRDFHMIWSHTGECRHESLWQWPPSQ